MSNFYVKKQPRVIFVPVIPLLSTTLGITLLAWVIWPILSFQLAYAKNGVVVIPVPEETTVNTDSGQNKQSVNLTKVDNWFPRHPSKKTVSPVDTYFLSIPKLGIVNATVRIGSNDLTSNLIHYGGSGLPGKYGNAVIFGHSVLPAFYNPKDYLAIFSLLPTLKEGDDIYIHFDGIDYRYKVTDKQVTTPEDVSGLEQRYDNSYLTLVTCVPPGTYWQRLWLSARRVQFSDT